ncbi:FMRFamide receptor-like [Liolophura sinensis]|uniref:FMRFamide receptor-like n=1 Tax=Liolophura sinensis TaxID=3198878 RepID=UPI0031593070
MGFGLVYMGFFLIMNSKIVQSTCNSSSFIDDMEPDSPIDIVGDEGLWNFPLSDHNNTLGNTSTASACNFTNEANDWFVDVKTAQKETPRWRVTYNQVTFVIRGIYFPVITTLALIGNALTVSVLRKDVLNSSSTAYLLGLAVADLLFAIFFAPTIFRVYLSAMPLRSFQTFYAFYASYFLPLVNTFHTAAVWVTTAFTIERFVAVAMPMKAQKYCTKSRAKKVVVAAFVCGISLNIPRFFRRSVVPLTDPVTNETYYTHKLTSLGVNEQFEQVYFWIYFLATKVIPFPLLASLNFAVLWHVWRARWDRVRLTTKQDSREDTGKSRENQITRMLIMIVTVFLVCNATAGGASLYVALYGLKTLYINQNPAEFYMFSMGEALINTNPLVNCVLYAACSQTMRKELLHLFCPKMKYRPSLKTTSLTQETRADEESEKQ